MNNNPLQKRRRTEKQEKLLRRTKRTLLLSGTFTLFFALVLGVTAQAADFSINVSSGDTAGNLGPVEVIFIFAFLSILPSVFLMMTSFARLIIVFGFLRQAMGTAQAPPNMVLVGLSLFLTLFIMMPVLNEMNEVALQPFLDGDMEAMEALEAAAVPVKRFMVLQTNTDSMNLFLEISETPIPEVEDVNNPVELLDLPLTIITPAFIVSEISRAFLMGFLIYLPFLIIDMVVSSILMSMGMMMLPPAMVSMPFKLLMFVLVDGWNLTIGTLVNSYQM